MYASFNLVLCHPTIIKHVKICIDSQDDDFILFLILGKTSKTNYTPLPLPLGPLPSPRSVIYASLEVGSIDLDIR